MKPIEFKETNLLLTANGIPSTESMPVALCKILDEPALTDTYFMVSCWKLEPHELNKILETGVIWVSTMGVSAKPILLTSKNPMTELGYEPVPLPKH